MLDAFRYLLFSESCQHNRLVPTQRSLLCYASCSYQSINLAFYKMASTINYNSLIYNVFDAVNIQII